MKLLLDTHALAWWLSERSRLSQPAQVAISTESNQVFVSVVNAWEMAIKVGRGNWPAAASLVDGFEAEIAVESFQLLPIAVAHVRLAGMMQHPHRDPFDRLLAAQAQLEGLTLVTADPKVQAIVFLITHEPQS